MPVKVRRATAKDITQAGGLQPLVLSLIESVRSAKTTLEQKEFSAMMLRSLTEQSLATVGGRTTGEVIAEAGGISPLVHLAEMGTPDAQAFSLAALANVSTGRPDYQQAMLAAGGVPRIARCLRVGGAALQTAAAAAMASVSQLMSTQVPFLSAGVVPCIVTLLSRGDVKAVTLEVHAAQTLANLARDHPAGQEAIGKAGAICLLVRLWESGTRHLIARLPDCPIAWLPDCLVARLPGCPIARLPGCLIA